MNKVMAICLIVAMMFVGSAWAEEGAQSTANSNLEALLYQFMYGQGYAEGGDAAAESGSSAVTGDSTSGASVDIRTTSISNIKNRTPPLTVYPPYLPYWNHGGWGTLKAYFPTGPNADAAVYERTFCPDSAKDMQELKGVLEALPHKGPLEMLGGIFNSAACVFGAPDNFHHGRGLEIANSLIRQRRPPGKSLLLFVDSNVDRQVLDNENYVYVGKVGIEGDIVGNNWDHAYDAAVAEALPWDVDILLVSGGMKGVTTGSTTSFPGVAGAYSQVNYSLSLLAANSTGIVESKAKAQLSVEGYRFWPEGKQRRKFLAGIADRIRVKPQQPTQAQNKDEAAPQAAPAEENNHKKKILPETTKPISNAGAVEHPMNNENQPWRAAMR